MCGFGKEAWLGQLKQHWRNIRPELLSGLIYMLVRGIACTLRVRAVNFPVDQSKMVFCGWHGRSLVFANYFRNRNYWVIISTSRDGDMQNAIFTRLGFRTIRGSTGRGGARAAIESIRALREGGTMAITPDGPRGPSGVVQGGVTLMALKSGAKLIPVGISAKPRCLVRSWDRYMVPLPFARALLIFGEPLEVPSDATEEQVEQARLQLQSEIHRLHAQAEAELGIQ
jgi:lysophospholipid acyltransferase (LPLAT)-like uncharacterized protein